MFPLQPRDELVLETSSIPQPDKLILDDLTADHALQTSNLAPTSPKRQRQVQFSIQKNKTERSDECSIRRIIRREIEKQRRHQMAKLYASLRSLLPLHCIKGKRSVSDHMLEAVGYIKFMRKRIQELKIRRDNLKKRPNLSDSKTGSSNDGEILPNLVMVNQYGDGLEILISSSIKRSRFGLSRALAELQGRQLNVVNCVSTKAKDRFLHKIQAEATNVTNIDPPTLQEKLTYVIN